MKELDQIKDLVEKLEEKVRELEQENFALRNAIASACNSLISSNADLATTVHNYEGVSPRFKQPNWVRKEK